VYVVIVDVVYVVEYVAALVSVEASAVAIYVV